MVTREELESQVREDERLEASGGGRQLFNARQSSIGAAAYKLRIIRQEEAQGIRPQGSSEAFIAKVVSPEELGKVSYPEARTVLSPERLAPETAQRRLEIERAAREPQPPIEDRTARSIMFGEHTFTKRGFEPEKIIDLRPTVGMVKEGRPRRALRGEARFPILAESLVKKPTVREKEDFFPKTKLPQEELKSITIPGEEYEQMFVKAGLEPKPLSFFEPTKTISIHVSPAQAQYYREKAIKETPVSFAGAKKVLPLLALSAEYKAKKIKPSLEYTSETKRLGLEFTTTFLGGLAAISTPIKTTKRLYKSTKKLIKAPVSTTKEFLKEEYTALKADPRGYAARTAGGIAVFEAVRVPGVSIAKKAEIGYLKVRGVKELEPSDVFAREVVSGEATFPTTRGAEAQLARFEKARTKEGKIMVASAGPSPLKGKEIPLTKASEAPGLYVTSAGEASPYFTRIPPATAQREFGLLPKLPGRPAVAVGEVSAVKRLPSSLRGETKKKAAGFPRGVYPKTREFLIKEGKKEGPVKAHISPMVEAGSGEFEAIVAPGVPLTHKGLTGFVVYRGRAVRIRKVEFGKGISKPRAKPSKPIKAKRIARESRDLRRIETRRVTPIRAVPGIGRRARPARRRPPVTAPRRAIPPSRRAAEIPGPRRPPPPGRRILEPTKPRPPPTRPRKPGRTTRPTTTTRRVFGGYPRRPGTITEPILTAPAKFPKDKPKEKKRKKKTPVRQPKRYRPTATAAVTLKIGKPTGKGVVTGLGFRPVLRSQLRKKEGVLAILKTS